MTRVDFYTSAKDKLGTACLLSAKAFAQGLKVTILTPDHETSRKLEEMLWRIPQTGFIPHCMATDPLAAETPVLLDEDGKNPLQDEVLLNLGRHAPPSFSRFRRLVEIIGEEEEDIRAGRERYRFYRDRGYETHHHKLNGRGEG